MDSVDGWAALSKADRARYRPQIAYVGESGIDTGNFSDVANVLRFSIGGLMRSWFVENTKLLFDPAFGLFKVAENSSVIHPNVASKIIPDHLTYFEFAGYHVAMVPIFWIVDTVTLTLLLSMLGHKDKISD